MYAQVTIINHSLTYLYDKFMPSVPGTRSVRVKSNVIKQIVLFV